MTLDFSNLNQLLNLAVFGLLALVILATAIVMLFSRNTVYAALFLVINFLAVGILYLILGAPFIALAQVAVYAGAIMVLFLFVIMLLGVEKLPAGEPIKGQRVITALLGLVFVAELGLIFLVRLGNFPALTALSIDQGSPRAIGEQLFQTYMLPFEITSVILLVAVVGAILLTRHEPLTDTPTEEE
jgi:NADH-quinone oxidoreductase subunit J